MRMAPAWLMAWASVLATLDKEKLIAPKIANQRNKHHHRPRTRDKGMMKIKSLQDTAHHVIIRHDTSKELP